MSVPRPGGSSAVTTAAAAPPKRGYDVEYERLLMEELSLKRDREGLLKSSTNDAGAVADVKLRGMIHRASLEGMLLAAQHAADEAKADPSAAAAYEPDLQRPEARNALAALWDTKARQLEEDDGQLPLVIDQESLAWRQRLSSKIDGKNSSMSASRKPDLFEANVDDFFSAFPECRRRDDTFGYSDIDESDSDEDDCDIQPPKGKKKQQEDPILVSCSSGSPSPENPAEKARKDQVRNQQQRTQSQKQPRPVSNSGPSRDWGNQQHQSGNHRDHNNSNQPPYCQQPQRQQNQRTNNPYQQQQQRRGGQPNQWQNGYANRNQNQSSGFDYSDNDSYHIDQNQPATKQNPFRSAKELGPSFNDKSRGGKGGRGGNDWDEYDNNGGYSGNNNNHRMGGRNNRSASSAPGRPQQMVQAAIRGPKDNISSGLKRKFKPPMKREGGGNGQSNGNGNNNNRNSSNQAGGANNGGKNDDEELPEELRGLDKELIEKIDNEIVDSGEKVTFNDIAGLEHAKAAVNELVIMPMKRPDLFTGLRACPKGMLLFGPPGTGKTLIAKAISHESGATFFSISSSSLTSKWIGEGEKLVRTLFAVANYRAPSVVFMDEVDSLLTQRKADENEASRRIKTEFLVQLDGAGNGRKGQVLILGATNLPHELDDAARRRFVKRVYIPLPDQVARKALVQTLLTENKHCLTDEEIDEIARKSDGFSGADLAQLCKEAAYGPMRDVEDLARVNIEDLPPISYEHFCESLDEMNPSVAQEDLAVYVKWNETYGSKGRTKGRVKKKR